MALPKINAANLKKPLCFDPGRRKFIYFDDIVSGREKVVPVDTLSEEEMKELVVERQRAGPDYRVQAISGPPMTRDDVVRAIQRGETFGRVTVEAEKSYLRDLLREIQRDLE